MEISLENVIDIFKLYSGESFDGTDLRRDALCRELCEGCVQETMALPWKQAEEGQEDSRAAEKLAAAGAFYQLALVDMANCPKTLSTPEIKLSLDDRADRARRLRDEKQRACEGMLCERGFYFGLA